ncbi:MAG: hypothetical protein HY296_06360 [Thaumarchaeota archaeon]|nr:hypothetical protein [Nitrososphaerota archaeon]
MVKSSTVGGVLGLVTGFWTLGASYFDGVAMHCPLGGCPYTPPSYLGIAIIALGGALVSSSAVSFFLSRNVLYVSGGLSALVGVLVLINASQIDSTVLWITLLLSALTAAVDFVAARSRTAVSEQSHPMNLPVFG